MHGSFLHQALKLKTVHSDQTAEPLSRWRKTVSTLVDLGEADPPACFLSPAAFRKRTEGNGTGRWLLVVVGEPKIDVYYVHRRKYYVVYM